MAYKTKNPRLRKFKIYSTAFKGTKYRQESAWQPVVEARDVKSAIMKIKKGVSTPASHGFPETKMGINPSDIYKIEEV